MPPSTSSVCPVMYSLASEARKTMAPLRSFGCPGHFNGMRSFVLNPLLIVVKHRVLLGLEPSRGQTVHGYATRYPLVRQTHRQLLDAATACAVGRNTRIPKHTGYRADVDDPAITALHHALRECLGNKEARLVSITRFQSSHVMSSAGFLTLHPALLTRMSILPKWLAAAGATALMLSASRTSSSSGRTCLPNASISS